MVLVLWIIALAVLGGILYRMGGSSEWNTLYRDLGVSAVSIVILRSIGYTDAWMLALTFVILYGAMTTYFDKINKFFGHSDKEFWLNWMLIGISYSLATLPIVIKYSLWKGFMIRTAVLPVIYVVTDAWIDRADFSSKKLAKYEFTRDRTILKEFVRGFFNCITLPLLLIK